MKSINQVFLLTACCTMLLTACNKAENPGATLTPAASAAANVSDADVTIHVKSALDKEPGLAGLDITVVTTKGDVRLTGVVSSQAQIDTAISAARAAQGAHTIHDELTVKQ
ncbi:MAG: BON domain-containing protein [Polaromonas sp.]|jgi:hyperosmotically inducible protein|nr:BON domain-containing protein [Polaromonas sp.]MDO8755945.1 BON domain-containing protein [Polaromonas sp.]